MSLSEQFKQQQVDKQQANRDATSAALGAAMERLSETFPRAVKGVAARAVKGKRPSWLQKRRTEKWVWGKKEIQAHELRPEFFEKIPGFSKLRNACAAPNMDIAMDIYVMDCSPPGVCISVDPTRPFSAGAIRVPEEKEPLTHLWMRQKPTAHWILPIPPPPAPPPSNKITVLPVLQLKR